MFNPEFPFKEKRNEIWQFVITLDIGDIPVFNKSSSCTTFWRHLSSCCQTRFHIYWMRSMMAPMVLGVQSPFLVIFALKGKITFPLALWSWDLLWGWAWGYACYNKMGRLSNRRNCLCILRWLDNDHHWIFRRERNDWPTAWPQKYILLLPSCHTSHRKRELSTDSKSPIWCWISLCHSGATPGGGGGGV